ncbi:hypothetical protein RYZ18_03820 [Roseovarius sp. 10]|nr:hypothetical protein [Roseovarius sp. 10]MDV7200444.1 hypothetical protein [Roseovarius sp. 10]
MGLDFKTTTKPKKRFRLLVILAAMAMIASLLMPLSLARTA